jgi:hypothetical protein
MGQAFADQLCPNWVPALDLRTCHPIPSTNTGLTVVLYFAFRIRHPELTIALVHVRNHRTLHEMAAYAVARRHGGKLPFSAFRTLTELNLLSGRYWD